MMKLTWKTSWPLCLALVTALAAIGCDDGVDDTDSGPMMTDGGTDAGPTESCDDGEMNQDETDVDCGGSTCDACRVGEMCDAESDCTTMLCDMGACQPLPTCDDGTMNGMETDVDCGGMMCATCDEGEMCGEDDDCSTALCDGGTCTTPVCGDGAVEGLETCDEGSDGTPMETADCDVDCTAVMCGDGVQNISALEECDGDGAGMGGETATCDVDCTLVMCGDGVTNTTAGEDCDGDGAGTGGETATCNSDCTAHMCGDGVLNVTAGEDCDDGNTTDGDGCESDCTVPREDVMITADATFDTDAGTLDGTAVAGWSAAINTWYANTWTLAAGATLTVTGANAFLVVTDGDVIINGTIEASGQDGVGDIGCDEAGGLGGAGGPGGFAGGDGGGPNPASDTPFDGSAGMGPGSGGGGTCAHDASPTTRRRTCCGDVRLQPCLVALRLLLQDVLGQLGHHKRHAAGAQGLLHAPQQVGYAGGGGEQQAPRVNPARDPLAAEPLAAEPLPALDPRGAERGDRSAGGAPAERRRAVQELLPPRRGGWPRR